MTDNIEITCNLHSDKSSVTNYYAGTFKRKKRRRKIKSKLIMLNFVCAIVTVTVFTAAGQYMLALGKTLW